MLYIVLVFSASYLYVLRAIPSEIYSDISFIIM